MGKLYSPQSLDSGTAGVSGLQFVRLTSATASTAGVAYAGIDVSGNVVIAPVPAVNGGRGSATINFGAFPGTTDSTSVITGQTLITAGSTVQAWLSPTTTADHSADEHLFDGPKIMVGNIVPGTGFTIYGMVDDQAFIEDINSSGLSNGTANTPLVYGQWTVAWLWS